jgi:hypothetical protein
MVSSLEHAHSCLDQAMNSSIPVTSRSFSLCPFPCPSAASFVIKSAQTGLYQLFVPTHSREMYVQLIILQRSFR